MKFTQSGITLIEACAVLAIAAILAGSGLPAFRELADARRLEGVSDELSADLQHARSQAVAQQQAVRFSVTEEAQGGSCYVIHTGPLGACTCDSAGQAACTGQAQAIKAVGLPQDRRIGLISNSDSLVFDPVRGTTSPTATLRLAADDGREIRHIVNLMGRLRICDTHRPSAGRPRC